MPKKTCFEAARINGGFKATDFHPYNCVHIITDEGYNAQIPSAFARKWHNWYFIFAEHHLPQIFEEGDVETLYQYAITTHQQDIVNLTKKRRT